MDHVHVEDLERPYQQDDTKERCPERSVWSKGRFDINLEAAWFDKRKDWKLRAKLPIELIGQGKLGGSNTADTLECGGVCGVNVRQRRPFSDAAIANRRVEDYIGWFPRSCLRTHLSLGNCFL